MKKISNDKLALAAKKFKQFHLGKKPRQVKRVEVDTTTPLVEIGRVPMLTYISSKTGKRHAYKHDIKHLPKMYAHPDGKFFVILGGSTKIKDWLID